MARLGTLMITALNADAIFNDAAATDDLARYADADLRERFSYLIDLLNAFGSIEQSAYPGAVQELRGTVEKRLRVARDWDVYPEILAQRIEQPFFVIGNARAGTTFAQAILALDEGHRTPVYREVQNPSPPRGVDPDFDRVALHEQNRYVDYLLAKSPRMLMAHPYLDQGGDAEAEDEYVYSLDFHLAYPLWLLKVPNLPQALPPRNAVLAMQFHKNMLKQFQWKTPTRRWIGKGVVHHYILPAVLEVYPDAVCFWIHRAPEEYIASLLELLELQYKPFNGGMYRVRPEQLVADLKRGVDHILASPATRDPRVHHVRFKDWVRDPRAVIAPIYEAHGISFSDEFSRRIKLRIEDPNGRPDRYGKFDYSLEKFALTREGLRTQFAAYCERFGL
jgi:Sulfotransferase family